MPKLNTESQTANYLTENRFSELLIDSHALEKT